MNNRTLTSANAIILLSVTGLYDAPQRIQGFSADDVTDADAVDAIESSMGVDGRLSAGFVPVAVRQNITLQADSQSNDLFENWDTAQQAARELYIANGTVIILATGRKYAMTRGFLRSVSRLPSLKKTIQPRRYTIEWERVTVAPA